MRGSAHEDARQLERLADGVWVWRESPPERTGSAGDSTGPAGDSTGSAGYSNAGVVVDGDGATVVDSLMVRSQWAPFAAAVAELGVPVRRLVLTHAHIEQVGGSRAFGHAAVVASRQTSDLLEVDMPVAAYQRFMPAFADELAELAELGTRQVTHVVEGPATLTDRCEVLPVTGHTAGDVMVLVPDADVLFAGGIASFGEAPLAFQGDPATWAAVLDTLGDVAETIVPGHGPVGGPAECRVLADYLRHCVDAAGDPDAIPPGPWDDWPDRELRDAINVERAALLAQGDDVLPPTMVRAISPA